MEIILSPELENLINQKVASGNYNAPGEVISAGLRLLEHYEELERLRVEALRGDIRLAQTAMEHGDYQTYDSPEAFFTELMSEIQERLEEKKGVPVG